MGRCRKWAVSVWSTVLSKGKKSDFIFSLKAINRPQFNGRPAFTDIKVKQQETPLGCVSLDMNHMMCDIVSKHSSETSIKVSFT